MDLADCPTLEVGSMLGSSGGQVDLADCPTLEVGSMLGSTDGQPGGSC